jgi:hypothetical protein
VCLYAHAHLAPQVEAEAELIGELEGTMSECRRGEEL